MPKYCQKFSAGQVLKPYARKKLQMTSDMLTIQYLFLTEKTENSYLRNCWRSSLAFVVADMFLKSYDFIRGRKCDPGGLKVQTNM